MSLSLELISATLRWPGHEDCLKSWNYQVTILDNAASGDSLMESYQKATEASRCDILAFVHDDLVCLDPLWYERVLQEFSDPRVGLVGFAGALGQGSDDLYTAPYKLSNLGRIGFRSNLREAEKHGARFEGSCDVSVLDGLALFVRRDILIGARGWPLDTPIGYIGYDYWLCCITRLFGYRIRLVGVAVDHLGGKSTGLNPKLGDANFEAAHRYIYENFRKVLPARVK